MNTSISIYSKLNNIFLYSVFNEAVRERIGFHHVSGLTKSRGWYFWPNDLPGVFDLFTIAGEHSNLAQFLIKYYPAPQDPAFAQLTGVERSLLSNYPLHKGAPLQENRDAEFSEAFIQGRLDLLWEDRAVWFHLSTQAESRGSVQQDTSIDLSHNLHAKLLRAFCLFTRTPPSLVIRKTAAGFPGQTENMPQGDLPAPVTCQLISVFFPGAVEKQDLIREVALATGMTDYQIDSHAHIELLYQEGYPRSSPDASRLLDPMWWELAKEAAAILPQEMYI